jgi:hypothetical protein
MSTKYLLFKVSALEQVSSNQACRIAEDIITIICDPPPPTPEPTVSPGLSPTPTPTPTLTPQPFSTSFDTSITVAGSSNTYSSISGNGVTITSSGGTSIAYGAKSGSATMSTLSIRMGNPSSYIEAARLVFIDEYMNNQFRLRLNGIEYIRLFSNGIIYL